jgi:hypothetical protein
VFLVFGMSNIASVLLQLETLLKRKAEVAAGATNEEGFAYRRGSDYVGQLVI